MRHVSPALGQDERSLVPLYSIDDAITETRHISPATGPTGCKRRKWTEMAPGRSEALQKTPLLIQSKEAFYFGAGGGDGGGGGEYWQSSSR